MAAWQIVFAPGLFSNPSVQAAMTTGALVGLVCAPVGVLTVLRGQSFAAHAFSDIAATGGSAAFLVGTNPLVGFVLMGLTGAVGMHLLGREHGRGRDLATGALLGASLGLSALLLYLTSTSQSTSGAAVTVLFGSLFTLGPTALPLVALFGSLAMAIVLIGFRPVLLSSISPELAAARGSRPRSSGFAYLVALAVSVALSALTIGAVLSTALVVGPAAGALRLSRTPGRAMAVAAAISIAATWAGIVLSYDSYNWPPSGRGWPVSFFVVVLVLGAYLVSRAAGRRSWR